MPGSRVSTGAAHAASEQAAFPAAWQEPAMACWRGRSALKRSASHCCVFSGHISSVHFVLHAEQRSRRWLASLEFPHARLESVSISRTGPH
jgi:hypothetical protein